MLAFPHCNARAARIVCCDRMHRALVIAVALLAACGDEHVERMQAIKDEVCACKTVACAQAAMQKVGQKKLDSKPEVQRLAREMMACMAELLDEGLPSTDPDAEGATSPESAGPASAETP